MRSKLAVAIFVSDIHLSHNPPEIRKSEPDWYEAMATTIEQLRRAEKQYDCPIFCAGDLFHTWDQPTELVNFAIRHLPKMYAIPGQHDIPNHNLEELYRSAFATLIESGTIQYTTEPIVLDQWEVHMVPFGVSPVRVEPDSRRYSIAVIHQYNWIKGKGHLKAKKDQTVGRHRKEFSKFSLIVSGDNHNPFIAKTPTGKFVNCGCFMRRSLTELKYRPSYWVLFNDGTILRRKLNTKHEHILKKGQDKQEEHQDLDMDLSDFIQTLGEAGNSAFNVSLTLKKLVRELEDTKPDIAKHIKTAMKATE